jgi:hypothetical protein
VRGMVRFHGVRGRRGMEVANGMRCRIEDVRDGERPALVRDRRQREAKMGVEVGCGVCGSVCCTPR